MKNKKIIAAVKWLPVLIWAGVIYLFSSVPSLATPWKEWDFILRKCAHAVEYAVLCVLLFRALLSGAGGEKRGAFWAFVVSVLYALSDEIHQSYVRGRFCSGFDVMIDACGAAAGLILWLLIMRRRPRA